MRSSSWRRWALLAAVAAGMFAIWAVGGRRGLGWAALVLAAALVAGGVRLHLESRRAGGPGGLSAVLLGAGLACLGLARALPAVAELPLYGAALGLSAAGWLASRREEQAMWELVRRLEDEAPRG